MPEGPGGRVAEDVAHARGRVEGGLQHGAVGGDGAQEAAGAGRPHDICGREPVQGRHRSQVLNTPTAAIQCLLLLLALFLLGLLLLLLGVLLLLLQQQQRQVNDNNSLRTAACQLEQHQLPGML